MAVTARQLLMLPESSILYIVTKHWSLPLQSYLKLIKKQQKELNTLKKKHSKVGDCFTADLSANNTKGLLFIPDSYWCSEGQKRWKGRRLYLSSSTDHWLHTHTHSVHNVHRVLLSMLMCHIASSVSWLHKASLYKRDAGNYTTVSLLQAFPFPFLSGMDLWRFELYPKSKEGTQVKTLRSVYRSRHCFCLDL